MAMWSKATLAGAEDAIEAFGKRLRQARQRAGLSQMMLEQRSGVDQSLISRLELAKAPHASLERVVRLGEALGDDFPLGYCPHEHRCSYRPDWQPPPWEGHLPYQKRAATATPVDVEVMPRDVRVEQAEMAAVSTASEFATNPAADTEQAADIGSGLRLSPDGLVTAIDP